MTTEIQKTIKKGQLTLSKITIDPEYRKKWNVDMTDFVVLSRDGELVRPTLYRVGGFGTNNIQGKRFFQLIKYVEDYYSKDITSSTGCDPKHLCGRHCILDQEGNEIIVAGKFKSVYIIDNTCIGIVDKEVVNLITGQNYGVGDMIETSEFLFIGKRHSSGKVYKVNKVTGETETFN